MNPSGFKYHIHYLYIFCLWLSFSGIQAQQANDTLIASQYFKKADSLLIDRKLDSSIVYFKKALPIYKQTKTWERVAQCHNKISENQWRNSKYEESLVSAKKALEISTQYLKKNNLEEAKAYDNIGKYNEIKISDFTTAFKFYQKAFTIRLNILPKNHYLIANTHDNFSNLNIKKGNYKEALEHQKKALNIRIQNFGEFHPLSAESYNSIGNIHFYQWEYKTALFYYEKTLNIRKKIFPPNHYSTAISYANIGLIYHKKQLNDVALQYLKRSLVIKIKTLGKNHPEIARSYHNIGSVYRRHEMYDNALKYLKMALDLRINIHGKHHPNVGRSYYVIGSVFDSKGKYSLALQYYNTALYIKIKALGKNHNSIASIYNNIGFTYKKKGQYDRALNYYKKAITIKSKVFDEHHISLAKTYNNIGNIYKFKKDFNKALLYYQKALKIRVREFNYNHSEVADSYNDIGNIYLIKKDHNKALNHYKKALEIGFKTTGNQTSVIAESYYNLAKFHTSKGNFQTALSYYKDAKHIWSNLLGNDHSYNLDIMNKIASIYFKNENYQNALINYNRALKANIKLNTNNSSTNQYLDLNILLNTLKGQTKTYIALYQQSKNLDDLEKSISSYQKADTLINSIRQTLNNYEDKVAFANTVKEVYQGAIEAQLLLYNYNKDQNTLVQAFYYTEKSKANTLKDLLNDANAKSYTGLPSDLLTLEKDLRIDHAYYQSRITKEYSKQQIDSSKISNYESKLFDISRRQDSLTEVLEKKYPKYYQLKYQNKKLSVADIQQKLDESTTLLEFFTTDSTTYAFTITKNKLAATKLKTPSLKDNIQSLRRTITTKNLDNYQKQASALYTILIEPIKDQLQGDRLIIIPDGPLWHLNFDLLLTHNNYDKNITVTHPKDYPLLLKEYAISYVNTANLLFDTPDTTLDTKKRKECLAFSFSDSTKTNTSNTISFATLRGSNTDLPGTRKEIKAISDIIDGQYYYGSEAIEANFKKNADQYNILHLALHGEVDNERPENSKLFFTKNKDTIEDNLLYSHELFALDIPAELTVLSACNTGSGKIAKGEGIISLGTAFQYAGTKSLLLTNWAVSDETTPQLMQYFYTNLKEGMSKDKALQQAKLQYLNTDKFHYLADPFYWGGFYLVGDTTPIQFSQDYTWYWGIGFVVLGILLLSIFFYQRKKTSQ
ncbi:CHAT domain-containing protein [Aquimarina sp. 2201CG5-10]|uniref:CHAT domain-containing protein n=1 Tax=Aquimarina callyspongiae TaxID=3098150 RepID=UPI002AB36E2F|nr:tetratricopeptide repeat protein [Aquimarina sp. 2201CG5-10]MDY8134980.1 tetratricopeptide repeat protein [Aquimarina sp. 2201CG5-10]